MPTICSRIGCVGLMKAVDNFDPGREVKFSTYAVPMIIGEIRRYLRDNNSIRVSRSLRDTAYKAIYAKEGYMKKHMKEPTVQEIGGGGSASRKKISSMRWMRSRRRSVFMNRCTATAATRCM